MKNSLLLIGALMATVALTQAQTTPSPDSLASVHKIHEVIDYNMHMLDELEPLLQRKGDATTRLLIQIKTNTAWFKTQLLLTDLKLTEATLDLRAAKQELKAERRKNVWRTIGAGAGGLALGIVIMALASP